MLPNQQALIGTFLLVLDLVGAFVFALSGAMAGVRNRLDLFGVLVLSFAAASAGGIVRDLLIGAVPPAGITDWRYVGIATLAGLLTFYGNWVTTGSLSKISLRWGRIIDPLSRPVLILDAAGLALYAVTGALKADAFRLGPVAALLLGVLTGVGGGVARDLLVSAVPTVLRAELYAVTALAGAAVVVGGRLLELPSPPVAVAGAILCFGLRIMAIYRGWRLPIALGAVVPPEEGPPPRQSER